MTAYEEIRGAVGESIGSVGSELMQGRLARLWASGLGWVLAQFALLLGGFLLCGELARSAVPSPAWADPLRVAAMVISAVGVCLLVTAALGLGSSLTALPAPNRANTLRTRGLYALCRHPIYLAVLLLALGAAVGTAQPLALLFPAHLFVFFDRKARLEEQYLRLRHPEYDDYARRVKRLIPGIY